ncbi:MAG: FxLYD domain-containing protein [Actinobacteria bacterium]|nr:FxLYD domain-containing protein [Actinomycetota bacterium]
MGFFKRLLVLAVVAVIAGFGWAAFAGQSKNSPPGSNSGQVIKDQKAIFERLLVQEPNFYIDDYEVVRIYGSVKNIAKQRCSYVKLAVKVRNKQGKLLKELTVSVKDVGPNEIKSYDINGGTISESIGLESAVVEAAFVKR